MKRIAGVVRKCLLKITGDVEERILLTLVPVGEGEGWCWC